MRIKHFALSLGLSFLSASTQASSKTSEEHYKAIKTLMGEMLSEANLEFSDFKKEQMHYHKKFQEYKKKKRYAMMATPLTAFIGTPIFLHYRNKKRTYKIQEDKEFTYSQIKGEDQEIWKLHLLEHYGAKSEKLRDPSAISEVCITGNYFGEWLDKAHIPKLTRHVLRQRHAVYDWSSYERALRAEDQYTHEEHYSQFSNLMSLRFFFQWRLSLRYRERLEE